MTQRTVRKLPKPYVEPPSTSRYKIFLYIIILITLGWGLFASVRHITKVHAAKVASQEQQADQEAIDRVNSRHLIPTPTPQVVQVQDPAMVQKLDELTKEVQGLR